MVVDRKTAHSNMANGRRILALHIRDRIIDRNSIFPGIGTAGACMILGDACMHFHRTYLRD